MRKAEAQSVHMQQTSDSVSGGAATQHSALGMHPVEPALRSVLGALTDVELKWHEPLSRHTTFRVGGPVLCLARPRTEDALVALMGELRKGGIPHVVLGGGSNVLAPDEPWEAVAVQLVLSSSDIRPCGETSLDEPRLYVGAGVRLARWLGHCLRHGLSGVEGLVGIPGTVGGALVMNAGTAGGSISDILLWVDLIDDTGKRQRVQRSQLAARYRSMGIPQDWIVLGGCFRLTPSPAPALKARWAEVMRQRKSVQPLDWPSAGCVFRNPPHVPAGRLIEKAGLKGFRIGDAQVSEKHANWIINRGGAKARDILALIEHIEDRVLDGSGVRLVREIKVLRTEETSRP